MELVIRKKLTNKDKVCVMARLEPDVKKALDKELKRRGDSLQAVLEAMIKHYIQQ